MQSISIQYPIGLAVLYPKFQIAKNINKNAKYNEKHYLNIKSGMLPDGRGIIGIKKDDRREQERSVFVRLFSNFPGLWAEGGGRSLGIREVAVVFVEQCHIRYEEVAKYKNINVT